MCYAKYSSYICKHCKPVIVYCLPYSAVIFIIDYVTTGNGELKIHILVYIIAMLLLQLI